MDKETLVKQITLEVLAALEKVPGQSPPPFRALTAWDSRDLVLFAGSAEELRCLMEETRDGARGTLVLAGDSGVRLEHAESLGFARVVYMDEGQRPGELVADCTRVLIPVYTYQQLANLAGLCDSCWYVRVALKALADGRPVVVLPAGLPASSPFRHKVDAYLREIAGYGIQVAPIEGTHHRASPGKVENSPGAIPPPPPARSVLQPEPLTIATAIAPAERAGVLGAHARTGSHNGSSPCQFKAVGECAGVGQCARHLPERVGIIVEHGADRLSAAPGVGPLGGDVAGLIDHTMLKPDATREEILQLCEEARTYGFASVCVNPTFVRLAAGALRGSDVKVCTVIGFPLGANTSVTKAMETRDAVANGADEIDMVINVGALKARNDDLVRRDIDAVVGAADGRIVKVILETALLDDDEKVRACKLAREAGADFVKTSTGFGPGGATARDIALMRQTVGRYMGVKASGGIKDLQIAQEMLAAGATRIGASASVKIVKGGGLPPGKYSSLSEGSPTGGKAY